MAPGDRYDPNDYYNQNQELEDYLRFLYQYDNRFGERNMGLGGTSLPGRNLNGIGGNLVGRNLGGLGGSSLAGRNTHGIGGNLVGRDVDGARYSRFVDSLGGGNLVRSMDYGRTNMARNLDSIGGGNLVKKNLDQLGGPHLIKRTLDSLGGGNLVRNLDSIGGGSHKTSKLDALGGGHQREARDVHRGLPFLFSRRLEYASPYGANYEELHKRNFDEIDRSELDPFVKRNFDEIDQTSMPFPYAVKRFYRLYGNYLDTPPYSRSNFDKKRLYRPEYPMDEIDLSHFPIGSKRSLDSFPFSHARR
ncbi:uncharacterized protein LOC113235889 [Hyposmocoma kahamanoa]|uniref:uncharacterized protein LOC113235889 n=1 Tax=Hyposmocoma kahamanoa TaxID=1477025 RepID=UPI000E6D8005|nr:uncharacterized protein LOC113235889 [Hyposmocoma kahamanoa]